MPTLPPRRRSTRLLPTLSVALLVAGLVLVGPASAATDTDGDGLPNSYERDWTRTDLSTTGLVNGP